MPRIIFTAAAEAEIVEAVDWYEERSPGLSLDFTDELATVIRRIRENAQQFPIVHKDLRRALLRRFPYGVFFREKSGEIHVLACLHASRNPRRWRSRA
jgi:plasmid stabilization system protein ParE